MVKPKNKEISPFWPSLLYAECYVLLCVTSALSILQGKGVDVSFNFKRIMLVVLLLVLQFVLMLLDCVNNKLISVATKIIAITIPIIMLIVGSYYG